MAEIELVGEIDCLLCGYTSLLKLSKKSKPYYSCQRCNAQVFSRGDYSADKLMLLVKKEEAPKVPVLAVKPKQEESEGGFLGGIW